MTPKTKILIELAALFLLLLLGNLAQAYFLVQATQKNRILNQSLNILEDSFEQQRLQNQSKSDSLEQLILKIHLQSENLKTEIDSYEKSREINNAIANENQAHILRLHDLDSLHAEVARHYRH